MTVYLARTGFVRVGELYSHPIGRGGRKDSIMKRRRLIQVLTAWAGAVPLLGSAGISAASTRSRSLVVLDSRIAGFAHYQGKTCLKDMAVGDNLRFCREPENIHDQRAIVVYWNEIKIGYVPRSHNRALCQLMDASEIVSGEIKRVEIDRGWEPLYFTVRVLV